MNVLMGLLGWEEKPDFRYVHGFNVNATVDNCDAYVSVYSPDPLELYNRVSLTGNQLTIECSMPEANQIQLDSIAAKHSELGEKSELIKEAKFLLGIDRLKVHSIKASVQKYSKILPIDDNIRKRFIMWATDRFNIYSLGRFATWRPGLLLDDVVNDVRVIRKIIKNGQYDHKKQL